MVKNTPAAINQTTISGKELPPRVNSKKMIFDTRSAAGPTIVSTY